MRGEHAPVMGTMVWETKHYKVSMLSKPTRLDYNSIFHHRVAVLR